MNTECPQPATAWRTRSADRLWGPSTVVGVAALSLLTAVPAAAEFLPTIGIGVTHTDNINLSSTESIDQTVWQVNPNLTYTSQGTTFDATVNANLQILRFQERSETETFEQYNALFRLKGWDEQVFLDFGGNRGQMIVSPNAGIPTNNLALTDNRQNRSEYFVAPGVATVLGSNTALRASVRQGFLEFSGAQNGGVDVEQRSANFELDNIAQGSGGTWAFRYDWRRSDFDNVGVFENQSAIVELGYWVSARARVFGSVGQESPWDDPLNPSLEDTRWEVGFSSGAEDRYRIEVAAGERSFGSSGRIELTRQFARGSTSLTYSETPVSENQQIFRNPAFANPLTPDDLLARPGQPERFINKRLRWNVSVTARRTTAGLTIFRGERADRSAIADTQTLGDQRQEGFRVNVDRQMGSRTTLNALLWRTERDIQGGGGRSLITAFGLTGNYNLGPRTVVSFGYNYVDESPDNDVGALRGYVSNSVSLFIRRNFF